MPLKPRLTSYGSSFGRMNGDKITDLSSTGEIDTNSLNKNLLIDGVEFSLFDRTIKDYILARLGEPIVRVELSPFQIKVAIDEAVTKLSYHCPLWTKQYAVFDAAPGGDPRKSFKAHKVEIIKLDNTMNPHSVTELYGVYPKSWKEAELNYSTNEFHTIEVAFKFDFMDHFKYSNQ